MESRARFVVEPDAKLRITATAIHVRVVSAPVASDVMCTVEIRRGVAEHLTLTISGEELLRLVHDSVYVAKYG
jgi:hypothetical protein